MDSYHTLREEMCDLQLKPRGIIDPAVLHAMRLVPRHDFVPEELCASSYDDHPLPIGDGQTISQPYIVALMTQSAKLKPYDRVLEIGTGSGYQAAILSQLVKEVYSIERIPSLAKKAEQALSDYKNIFVKCGDGTLGWPSMGPFDAILVTAGAPYIPEALMKQLSLGGRLIIPVGDSLTQNLLRVTKISEKEVREELLEYVRFVPLIGELGWS